MSESTQPLNPRMIIQPAGPGGFFKDFDKLAGVLCFGIPRHIGVHGPRRAADPQ